MKHNPKSPYEKPLNECPTRCRFCEFFKADSTCTANGCRTLTYSFSNPKDRPLPMPISCYWWYANNVWDKLPKSKQEGYAEMRLHEFTASKMLETMSDLEERKEFLSHFFRPGGGRIIDFEKYPEAKSLYIQFKNAECRG